MAALPKKVLHLHAHRLADDIAKKLGMPHLDLSEVEPACLIGGHDNFTAAFARIAKLVRHTPVAVPPDEQILNDPVQAIIVLANNVAGPSATVSELNSALLMIFEVLPTALEQMPQTEVNTNADFFDAYHIQRMAKVLHQRLRQTKNDGEFERALEQVAQLHEQAKLKLGLPGLFRYMESTRYQVNHMRETEATFDPTKSGPDYGRILGEMLAAAHEEDGRFQRTDAEFNAISARAHEEVKRITDLQANLKNALSRAITSLTKDSAAPRIKFRNGVVPDIASWKSVMIDVVPGPFKKSLVIHLHGIDPDDPEVVGELLSALLGRHS